MAIPIDYPSDKLPAPLVGKQREQLQNYDVRDDFDGNAVTRLVRRNSPVYFDVRFTLNRWQANVFKIWLEGVSDGQEFAMPLKTEGGTFDHQCFFTELPINPTERRGDIYTYSGRLFARVLNDGLNTATDEEKEFVFELGEDISWLDTLVNESWPSE